MTDAQKKRLSLFLVAGFLIVLIGGGVVFYGSVTTLTKAVVERIASRALDSKVRIDSLDITPEKELVTLTGITIANPKGYSSGTAISIGAIDIDARNLSREALAFEDIKVTGMNIRLDVSDTGTNLSTLRQNAVTYVSTHKPDGKARVRTVIDHVGFTGTRLEPPVKDAIAKGYSPMVLPEIHMRAIGQQQGGLPIEQASVQVFDYVIGVALRAAAREGYLDSLSPEVRDQIGVNLSPGQEILEDTKQFLKQADSEAEMLGKEIKKMFRKDDVPPQTAPAQPIPTNE